MSGGVLAMLELDGDADELLTACERLERLLPRPAGLLARITARTETGIVLLQLWESEAVRAEHNADPVHHEALAASGIRELATAMRSRAFAGAQLRSL